MLGNGQIRPLDHRSGCPTRQHRPHLASVLREGRKSANIYAGLGVIWGIPIVVFKGSQTKASVSFPVVNFLLLPSLLKHAALAVLISTTLRCDHFSTFRTLCESAIIIGPFS
jgi:hypothetical protein